MGTQIQQPFTNGQIELLKIFSHDLSEEDLKALKARIADFFADRAITAADEAWDKNKWTENDVERMLNTKMRAKKENK